MSRISFITQIFMIVIAVVIVVVYIKPTFQQIQSTQETTAAYISEYAKVSDVNLLLKQKVSVVDGVLPADMTALKRYMPDSVDEVVVMKDLLAIFSALKLPLTSISAGAPGSGVTAEGNHAKLATHTFGISSQMSYSDLKQLLHALEVNDYLFQIDSLNLSPSDTGSIAVTMSLTTFSRTALKPTEASAEDGNAENQ